VNVLVDAGVFRRMLSERGKSGEDLRRDLGMSATTLAKLYGGEPVSDFVFRRVVGWMQEHKVHPIAHALLPPGRSGASMDLPASAGEAS